MNHVQNYNFVYKNMLIVYFTKIFLTSPKSPYLDTL